MALCFATTSLTSELRQLIKKRLTFQPDVSHKPKKFQKESAPINFYSCSTELLKLPYMFGREIYPAYQFPKYPNMDFTLSVPLRPQQQEVVNETWPYLNQQGAAILALHTAFGKTITALALASALKGPILVIYPPFEFLGRSWLNAIIAKTTCREAFILESREHFSDYLRMYQKIPGILMCMVTRVEWIPEEVRNMYRILIVDEAHLFCTQIRAKALLSFQPEYVLALTATLYRADGLYTMIEELCRFPVVRALTKPFTVTKVATGITPVTKKRENSDTLDWQAMVKWLCESEERNLIILQWLFYLSQQPISYQDHEGQTITLARKFLILTERKEHVPALSALFSAYGVPHATFFGGDKGYSDQLVIIGTFRKMSTGFDEENACADFSGVRFNTLFLLTSIKDHGALEQSVGRVMRLDHPDIFDFVDNMKLLRDHFEERCLWYSQKNCQIFS